MRRRELTHLSALFAVVLMVRYLLFSYVGIWGDLGFYTYDAQLINQGQAPFVDFIGRSPLFNYAFAAVVRSLPDDRVLLLRTFIGAWWVLAGVPAYLIGRKIHSHAAGLSSVVVLELSPFMLVYGNWANTQSLAALLAISGIAVIVYRDDWVGYAAVGLCVGTAFLSRRSVITIFGAVGLYIWYLAYHERDVRRLSGRSTAAVAGFLLPLSAGYLLMADFDIGLAAAFAETHAWGLISSSGRGGFPLITEASPPPVTRTIDRGRIPVFNDLCQLCGAWTARTFAKTMLVTVPMIGPLLFYFRDISDRYFTTAHYQYTFGILLTLIAYGAYQALAAGYYLRVGAIVSLVAFSAVAYWSDGIDRAVLYDEHMSLLVLVLCGLTAGYLFRNRLLHTYYFSDFMPYLSVLAGVLYVEAWSVMGDG